MREDADDEGSESEESRSRKVPTCDERESRHVSHFDESGRRRSDESFQLVDLCQFRSGNQGKSG